MSVRAVLVVVMALMALMGCASGVPLGIQTINEVADKKSTFTLIYYVGTSHYDVRRAVVLDLEGDEYEFIPEVKDFEYEILHSIKSPESLYETEVFFRAESKITGYVINQINDITGTRVVGYELRPLYRRSFYGQPDILDIEYRYHKEVGLVSVGIALKPGLTRPYMR